MKKGVIILFFLLFTFLLIAFYFLFIKDYSCNDGTFYNECSNIKPYFCSKGVLIEKASVCGCDNISMINSDKCISNFQVDSKNIILNYVLRGNKGKINFTTYKKLSDYVSKIPRYIDSNQNPTLLDFKLKFINEPYQRELLLPLVIQIENLARNKDDQMRIAVSLVQNIPFGDKKTGYQRYPYEVLYDMEGICSEKVELLIFLLREIGYGTSDLYYSVENHEAVGIKCPEENSVNNSGYCFVETTGPSVITDDKTEYIGAESLNSLPEILITSEGISLGKYSYEYNDARTLINIREDMKKYGEISPLQYIQFRALKVKYGLMTTTSTYTF